jgi:threonine/homoserine/homoserine lactone efflux protein
MSLQAWLAFVVAAGILVVIPGPTIVLVLGHSLSHGRRATLPLMAGVALGDFTAMSLSLAGLGAVMAASATLFAAFKWAAAIYLVFMGVSMWRAKVAEVEAPPEPQERSAGSMLRSAFVTTALNPKGIIFFVAFFPQFVDPARDGSVQLAVLGATFLVLGTLNTALYSMFAGRVRERIRSPRARRAFNRTGGTALIGAGLATMSVRHAS